MTGRIKIFVLLLSSCWGLTSAQAEAVRQADVSTDDVIDAGVDADAAASTNTQGEAGAAASTDASSADVLFDCHKQGPFVYSKHWRPMGEGVAICMDYEDKIYLHINPDTKKIEKPWQEGESDPIEELEADLEEAQSNGWPRVGHPRPSPRPRPRPGLIGPRR